MVHGTCTRYPKLYVVLYNIYLCTCTGVHVLPGYICTHLDLSDDLLPSEFISCGHEWILEMRVNSFSETILYCFVK